MTARRVWLAIGVAIVAVAGSAAAASRLQIDGPATVDQLAERLSNVHVPDRPATTTTTDPTPTTTTNPPGTHEFDTTPVATFDEAWAMEFLPGGSHALVTEQPGRLLLVDMNNASSRLVVAGTPDVAYGGQGGLGDVIVGPGGTATAQPILLSWVEDGDDGTSGAVVGRATLDRSDPAAPRLTDLAVIWRQTPKVTGSGHFSHRLALSPDQQFVFVSSGERQKMDPAQDQSSDLGKIIRIDLASGAAQHWTLGHRNPLGLEFAPDGRLWSSEMGPEGGDELNLITEGGNYGWPLVSNGSHYGGGEIPDHSPGDGFVGPLAWWDPSISPGSLMMYGGDAFPSWVGDAFLGALSGEALQRVDVAGTTAESAERWPMGNRIRVVVEDPRDGTIWLIEDGPGGRLLHLTPR